MQSPSIRRLMPARPLLLGLLAAGLCISASPAARAANVDAVLSILQKKGNAGAARGPKTIDDAAKAKVDGMAEQLAQRTGGKAYIVVLPEDEEPDDYISIYGKMGLGGKDVLIATNGKEWELRCDAIAKAQKDTLFAQTLGTGGNPLQRLEKLTTALPGAIQSSQKVHGGTRAIATTGARPYQPHVQHESGFPWGWTLFGALVAGAVGFVFWRRKQRDRALAAELKAALDPGESSMAEIFLGMDGLEQHPRFDQLLSRATGLSSKFDELKAQSPSRQAIVQAESLSRQARELHGEFRVLGAPASRLSGL